MVIPFWMVSLFISALASVWHNDLILRAYADVSGSVVYRLIPGFVPIMWAANPPENRKRFTVIGIAFYSVSVLVIALCIYLGLALEPVEGLEYVGAGSKWGPGITNNSTEYLIFNISFCWMSFEGAIYMINSVGVVLSKPNPIMTKILSILFYLFILFMLVVFGLGSWHSVTNVLRDIKNSAAV
ncbi:MAG: hypothetical protein IK056_11035 [Clostridia bacterium]|nr:hypothetical protein [Clostridia bacterium]